MDKYFPRLPSNKTEVRRKICQWIITNREFKGRVDVHDTYLLSLVDRTHVYILSQSLIILKAKSMWGPEMKTINIQRPCMNDRLRIIGIMALQVNRDMIVHLNCNQFHSRDKLDDKTQRAITQSPR